MPENAQVRIRLAQPEDVPHLREIDARTPIVLGDLAVTVDRGEDWFAPVRMMEDPVVLVAEVGEAVVGVFGAARHRARVAGEERWMLFINQARIAPEVQGQGIGSQFVGELVSRYEGKFSDSAYWYIPRVATSSQRFSEVALNKWEHGPYRASLATNAADTEAGGEYGRPAEPLDVGRVVEILNACHDGEEMFLPYTSESLAARLTREPELYSWPDVRVGEGAVVGVWRRPVEVARRQGETKEVAAEATAMDYGCLPGAEDELDRMLRATLVDQRKRGVARLAAYCSAGSPASPVVEALASERLDLDVWTPGVDEPPTAAVQGFYVDPVYA